MKRKAIGSKWAVFEQGGIEPPFDARSALTELVGIRTVEQPFHFIERTAANAVFTEPLAQKHWRYGGCLSEEDRNGTIEGFLSGSLETAINRRDDVDYLDELTARDLQGEDVYLLCASDLVSFSVSVQR